MYKNLVKEMKKKKISQNDIAQLFSGRQATISYKITRNKFYVDEAIGIQNTFFPELDIKYLFEPDKGCK